MADARKSNARVRVSRSIAWHGPVSLSDVIQYAIGWVIGYIVGEYGTRFLNRKIEAAHKRRQWREYGERRASADLY